MTWDGSGYDPMQAGIYEAAGTVALPQGWNGTAPDMKVQIVVAAAEAQKQEEENE